MRVPSPKMTFNLIYDLCFFLAIYMNIYTRSHLSTEV